MKATGTFDVKITPQASDLAPEGPNLGRMSLDKQYHGDLDAAAKGEMITAAGLAVKESAAYSAVERVIGTLHGKRAASRCSTTASWTAASRASNNPSSPIPRPASGVGLTGGVDIIIEASRTSYVFEYEIR